MQMIPDASEACNQGYNKDNGSNVLFSVRNGIWKKDANQITILINVSE